MSKYQEALNFLDFYCEIRHVEQQDLLQELIDRETPKKPIELINDERSTTHNCCPKCEVEVDFRYCSDCGQRLDWSDEE